MICLILAACLFGSMFADTSVNVMDVAVDVPVGETCKFGFYNLVTDDCCHFYQCDGSGRQAFRQSCMPETYWNTDTWTCDFSFVNGTCDDTNLICWDTPNVSPECDVNAKPAGESWCCELPGEDYDNRTVGFGNEILFDISDPTAFYVCGSERRLCPDGLFFNVEECTCNRTDTNCDCLDWRFEAADYDAEGNVLDQNQDTPIDLNTCTADTGAEAMVCGAGQTATLEFFQKAWFGNAFALTFIVSDNSDGVLFDNGDMYFGIAASLSAVVSGGTLTISFGPGFTASVSGPFADSSGDGQVEVVVRGVNGHQLELFIEGTLQETVTLPGPFEGSDCPLTFGQTGVTFYQFALCHYSLTDAQVVEFFATEALPAAPVMN